MGSNLSSSARKVQEALNALGMSLEVVELPASTRTAPEAHKQSAARWGRLSSHWSSKPSAASAPFW